MKIFFGIVVILAILFGITYVFGIWYLNAQHLDLNNPEIIARLLPLIPPTLATFATIAAAGSAVFSAVVVASINRRAQIDSAKQNSQYSKELEEKKKRLSAELEHEKTALDILKSDTTRRLELINHAMASLSEYSIAIVKLRRGIFAQELIEEKEQAIRIIAVQWEHGSELHKLWYLFLQSGIYLKELAERVTTDDEWRKIWWTAPLDDGKPPGQDFGELQEKVIEALCRERKSIIATFPRI
jgi:hypothetical protein